MGDVGEPSRFPKGPAGRWTLSTRVREACGTKSKQHRKRRRVRLVPAERRRTSSRYIPQADDNSDGSPFRIVIPRKLRKAFIRYFHDSALAGHSSGSKTYDKLCRVATWPGIRQDVLKYARSCPVCQKAKPRGGQPPGLMQPVVSQSPWQIVACDVMGPFPRSPRGNQYLLVVTDHFSK